MALDVGFGLGLATGARHYLWELSSDSLKTLEGATPGFPERQVPEELLRAGAKGESGGVSKVEGRQGIGVAVNDAVLQGSKHAMQTPEIQGIQKPLAVGLQP